MQNLSAFTRRWWPVLVAIFATVGIGLAITDTDGDGEPDRLTITIQAPDKTVVATPDGAKQIELGARAQQTYEGVANGDGELADPLREPNDPSRTPPGQLQGPLAAQEFPGCRTRFVSNYSSRNGVRPSVIVLHQTVSRERGLASQNALTAYANRRSSGVSWHLLVGPTNGLCTYSVPLNMKAWTQANANPFSIGIEVERFGDEPTYVQGLGEQKLIAILRELSRRYDIPLRKGKVVNCRVVTKGVIEHSDLGACGGGHADVTPWSTSTLIAKAAASGQASSATDVRRCNALRYHRRKVAAGQGYWTTSRVRRVRYLRSALAQSGVDQARCR